jgi:hypothetical protein
VLNNFFIKVGLRLVRSRLIPDKDTEKEIKSFIIRGINILLSDTQNPPEVLLPQPKLP